RSSKLSGRSKKLRRRTNFHQCHSSEPGAPGKKLGRWTNFHHRPSPELGGPSRKLRRPSFFLRAPTTGVSTHVSPARILWLPDGRVLRCALPAGPAPSS